MTCRVKYACSGICHMGNDGCKLQIVHHFYRRISSERHRQGAERLKQKLRQGVADGLFFPDINVEFSAAILIASVSTIFTSPSTYHSAEISMSEAFRYIMMCFFRGISTAEGLHVIDEMFGKYFP